MSDAALADPFDWRRRRAAPLPPRSSKRVAIAAALALALAAGAFAERAPIARVAHPILRSAGFPWRSANVKIESLTGHMASNGRDGALIVEGIVENTTSREIEVPSLRLAVRSADHAEIFVWSARPAKSRLAPGERTRFSSRLEDPPQQRYDVAASLEPPRD